jgi:rod shape-determining protein MreC
MFSNNPRKENMFKFALFSLLSFVIMMMDYRTGLPSVRTALNITAYPVQYMVDIPFSIAENVGTFFSSHQTLSKQNRELLTLVRMYAARDQKYRSIALENERLRSLLKTESAPNDRFTMAKILNTGLNRFRKSVYVSKGSADGLFEGQVALAGNSIYGQIITVSPKNAVVMQLTDAKHTIPVRNQRTGMQALAVGTGNQNLLELNNIEANSDIHVGDLFVSSGLGQIFPPDYPVCRVEEVAYNSGDSFSTITAKTVTDYNNTREVLLLWQSGLTQSSVDLKDVENNED